MTVKKSGKKIGVYRAMNRSTTEKLNKHKNRAFVTTTLILSFIVLSGFTIRLINLGAPGFGTDEPLHFYAAQAILETGEPEMPSGLVYKRGILFTKLVALSFRLLGISLFSARLPSVIFGTLVIILIFFVGKKYFGTTAGIIAAFLVAFSPFEIAWSRECRMYTVFQFFFLAGGFALYRGIENYTGVERNDGRLLSSNRSSILKIYYTWGLSWQWMMLSVVLIYISLLVHSLTAIHGISFLCYLFIMGILVLLSKNCEELIKSKYFVFFSIITVAGIFAVILIPGVFKFAKEHLLFKPEWASIYPFNPLYYFTFLSSSAAFPMWAFFVLGSIQIVTRKHKAGFYTLVCACVPLIILSFNPYVRVPRYIFNIYPLIILVVSYSISILFEIESKLLSEMFLKLNWSRYRKVISACLILIVVFAMSPALIYHGYQNIKDYYDVTRNTLGMSHRNWKDACAYVKKHYKPGDIIITTEPLSTSFFGCGNIDYYIAMTPEFEIYATNSAKRISDFNDFKKVLNNNSRGWIIIDSDRLKTELYIPEEIKLFLGKNFRSKIIEPHGTIVVFEWGENDFDRAKNSSK